MYSAAPNAGDEGFADVQGADLDGDCDVDVISAAITPDTVWWHEQTCVTPTRRLDDGACDDVMTQWMADNGYTSCAEFALRPKGLDNSCVNNANWVADGSCRQTCYDNGLGYDGDVCGGVAFRIESATDSQRMNHVLLTRFRQVCKIVEIDVIVDVNYVYMNVS